MTATPQDIESAALALSREQRAELARRLIVSLDEEDEISSAWQRETFERLDAYQRGLIESVAGDDVLDEARQQIQP